MKKYTLEEALPLVRQGREFDFWYGDCELVLFKNCDTPFEELIDAEFTLRKKKLENLSELLELKEAKFCGVKVSRDKFDDWEYADGGNIIFTNNTLNVNNWEYV